MRKVLACFFLIGTLLQTGCKFRQKADLIVHHARIYTVDAGFTIREAMAIQDGKLLAVGSNDEILKQYEAEQELNGNGQTILPGLIDAHCHFTGYATDLWKCALFGTKSFEEVLERLSVYAPKAPMYWLYGRGWDQNDWAVQQFPDKTKLDSLFPDRPVYLKRIDGHAALANQKALDIAGINLQSTIAGGIVEQKNGQLTGMLIDNAMNLLEKHIPPISDSLAALYFQQTQKECFAYGLTGVHDCGITEEMVDLIQKEQAAGRLHMKIYALLTDIPAYYDRWIKKGPLKTALLHVGGFKWYADGALGSRGACLIRDYHDQPGWRGFMLSDSSYFQALAQKLIASHLQVCTHAIGDSGNREMLRIYASVLQRDNDRRWRIEHAQVVNPADMGYFRQYHIIPSVQPTHATSDMYWAEERLGPERMPQAYAYQHLLQTNGWMPLGTDFPVEYINPFATFFSAVYRQDAKGFPAGGFQMADALSKEQALRGMTIWAAKAAFEEKEKGSLEPGKAADFVLLDRNILTCRPDSILQTKVNATYINGKKVFGLSH